MHDDARLEMAAEIEPDWAREAPQRLWDPARRLLRAIRGYQAVAGKNSLVARLARVWWREQHRFWSVVTQAEIDLGARIGGGLLLPHPNGIVVHPDAVIGPNCLVFQQVTIGMREGGEGVPVIGAGVDIGAGAKILGEVQVGARARIGANTVVIADVPAGCVAVGVPARILPPRRAAE